MIYKVQEFPMKREEAQARCDQDSEEAGVPGFLHLPMPRNEVENQIYSDIIRYADGTQSFGKPTQKGVAWLDIVEVQPRTTPRSWVYKDGSPVTWFNWSGPEPNNWGGKETEVQMYQDPEVYRGEWNDCPKDLDNLVVCTYFLPEGAENDCTWLHEFED